MGIALHKNDCPGKNNNNYCSDGDRQVRINSLNADFSENRDKGSEECRKNCVNDPGHKIVYAYSILVFIISNNVDSFAKITLNKANQQHSQKGNNQCGCLKKIFINQNTIGDIIVIKSTDLNESEVNTLINNPSGAVVLIIGNGGREHAIGWKLRNDGVGKIFFAPGNGGTNAIGENVVLDVKDFEAVHNFIQENSVNLTVIGSEELLAKGIVDHLESKNDTVFGPSQSAALIESSKEFARFVMNEAQVPQPKYFGCHDQAEANAAQEKFGLPVVIKANGLAAGKGVFVCHTMTDWENACKELFIDKKFKDAGNTVVVEEYLNGDEASIFAVCDGTDYRIIGTAQDHKRLRDNDEGPNTGGMGAYSPMPFITPALLKEIEETIIQPTLNRLPQSSVHFTGCLYTSIMLVEGKPYVIEFNCRFGDPEAQVILPLLETSLFELMYRSAVKNLGNMEIKFKPGYAVTVVKTSSGYPNTPLKGAPISGLGEYGNGSNDNRLIFHAGTAVDNGEIVTNGGRILNCVGIDNNLNQAVLRAYMLAQAILFNGEFFRTDIGQKGIKYLEEAKSK